MTRAMRSWDPRRLPNETHPEWILRMIVRNLQLLAADADTLLRAEMPPREALRAAGVSEHALHDDENIVATDVAEDLDSYLNWFIGPVVAAGLLSDEELEKARRVDARLGQMSGPEDPELWTDEGLRTRHEWDVVRRLAREALEAMGYRVEPPPPWSGRIVPARP